jgi:NitT/TauT family transport system substrate-binding protein
MPFNQSLTNLSKIFIGTLLAVALSGCNLFEGEGGDAPQTNARSGGGGELAFGAARYIPWLPWYYANDNGIFQQYNEEYNVNITFQGGNYDSVINRFIGGELGAIAITNIDALSTLIRRNIEADVILISSYSMGNDMLLLPANADKNIQGKTVAVKERSAGHYLLERYLLKNQIPFDDVQITRVTEDFEFEAMLNSEQVSAVATWNPIADKLQRDKGATILFDSHLIPQEIFHMVMIRRDIMQANPDLVKALLATWFAVMERMQGNSREATLDAFAMIAEADNRTAFTNQFNSIQLADNQVKALSIIRDRGIRKTMRHIRYFMERHELAGDVPVARWISYPGRTPNLIHFNASALQSFLEAPL